MLLQTDVIIRLKTSPTISSRDLFMEILIFSHWNKKQFSVLESFIPENHFRVVGVFVLFPSPMKKESAFCLTWHNSGGYFQVKVFPQSKANVSWKKYLWSAVISCMSFITVSNCILLPSILLNLELNNSSNKYICFSTVIESPSLCYSDKAGHLFVMFGVFSFHFCEGSLHG